MPIKTTIKQLVNNTGFQPLALCQGNPNYNPYDLPSQKVRAFFKQDTLLYEGLYNNQSAILKIILNTKNNVLRFQRERYCYTTLADKTPIFKAVIPRLFTYGNKPKPHLLIEKLRGKSLGDWYWLEETNLQKIQNTISLFVKLHQQMLVPRKIAYHNRCRHLQNYLRLNNHAFKTLALFKKTTQHAIIEKLKVKLAQAKPQWRQLRFGFVFNDFSPSNIFLTTEGIKFIDLETVGNGPISHDLALLTFAAIGTKSEEFVSRLCMKTAKAFNENYLFEYFLFLQCLIHTHKVGVVNRKKQLRLIEYLEK